jgi:thiosulfate reductase cytochrome b subunit
MTAGQQRKVQRVVHLAAALVLAAYVYAPLEPQLQTAVRFVVLPVLVLTGIAMWQAARIRRLRRSFNRSSALNLRRSVPSADPGAEM